MKGLPENSLDILVIAFTVFYILRGLGQGFFKQLASIIPWWGALLIGVLLSPWMHQPIAPYVHPPLIPYVAAVLGSALVFGLLSIGVSALNRVLQQTPVAGLSPILGALLGAFYAMVWLSMLIVACSFEPLASQPWVKQSFIIQKGLVIMSEIAYFELWKGRPLRYSTWSSFLY